MSDEPQLQVNVGGTSVMAHGVTGALVVVILVLCFLVYKLSSNVEGGHAKVIQTIWKSRAVDLITTLNLKGSQFGTVEDMCQALTAQPKEAK